MRMPGSSRISSFSDLLQRIIVPGALILVCSGCPSGSVAGPEGTVCVILADIHPLKDVQISVYPDDRPEEPPLAFGISDDNGRVVLRHQTSLEGVTLPEGEYRFTVESVGEFQLVWPDEFSDPARTPLRQSWSLDGAELILDVPEPKLKL